MREAGGRSVLCDHRATSACPGCKQRSPSVLTLRSTVELRYRNDSRDQALGSGRCALPSVGTQPSATKGGQPHRCGLETCRFSVILMLRIHTRKVAIPETPCTSTRRTSYRRMIWRFCHKMHHKEAQSNQTDSKLPALLDSRRGYPEISLRHASASVRTGETAGLIHRGLQLQNARPPAMPIF